MGLGTRLVYKCTTFHCYSTCDREKYKNYGLSGAQCMQPLCLTILTTSFFANRLQQYILAARWSLIDRGFPITSMDSPRMSRRRRDIFPLKSSPLLAEMELIVDVTAFCNLKRYFLTERSEVNVIPSVATAALESFS